MSCYRGPPGREGHCCGVRSSYGYFLCLSDNIGPEEALIIYLDIESKVHSCSVKPRNGSLIVKDVPDND